jgi:hypothetical protein
MSILAGERHDAAAMTADIAVIKAELRGLVGWIALEATTGQGGALVGEAEAAHPGDAREVAGTERHRLRVNIVEGLCARHATDTGAVLEAEEVADFVGGDFGESLAALSRVVAEAGE